MRYGVFDIESENWIRFKVLGFFDGEDYKTFDSPRKFLQYIDRKAYDGFPLYAHNGGKFDFLFLLDDLFRMASLKLIERQGRIIEVTAKLPRGNVLHFRDSYALLPSSLKKLGEAFKVRHQKTSYEFKEGAKVKVTQRLLKYLEQDCLCLHEVIDTFFGQDFIGQPQLTIASQALNTFRTKFLDGELYQVSEPLEDEFRDNFYSGGRVEVFKGEGTVNVYDVNSLFPSVMCEEMPGGVPKRVRTYVRDRIGFYSVNITRTPNFYIPPYLFKVESGQYRKNFFVNGPGQYYLSSAMLNALREDYGVRFTVNYGYVFPERKHIFNDYVNFFFKIKHDHKDDAQGAVAKLFLTSLYGKFAAHRWRESIETYRGQEEWRIPESPALQEFGLVLVERESKSKFILPYLAAYITDLARLKHWRMMQEAPDHCFYCDTDSIFTTATYKHTRKLGDLDLKGRFKAVFLSAKSYALKNAKEERVIFKGFKPEKFSFRDFQEALHDGRLLESEETRILSFRESLNRKSAVEESQGKFLNLVKVHKAVKNVYDKRKMLFGGKHFFDTKAYTWKEKA